MNVPIAPPIELNHEIFWQQEAEKAKQCVEDAKAMKAAAPQASWYWHDASKVDAFINMSGGRVKCAFCTNEPAKFTTMSMGDDKYACRACFAGLDQKQKDKAVEVPQTTGGYRIDPDAPVYRYEYASQKWVAEQKKDRLIVPRKQGRWWTFQCLAKQEYKLEKDVRYVQWWSAEGTDTGIVAFCTHVTRKTAAKRLSIPEWGIKIANANVGLAAPASAIVKCVGTRPKPGPVTFSDENK